MEIREIRKRVADTFTASLLNAPTYSWLRWLKSFINIY